MLTRRDILTQLKIMGVKELSRFKRECRGLEHRMAVYYDIEVLKSGKTVPQAPLKEKTPPGNKS